MPVSRIEGVAKVTGQARYAAEFALAGLAYGWVVQSTIARGPVHSIDAAAVLGMPGVLAVITHQNAVPLQVVDDGELLVLQDRQVHYRGRMWPWSSPPRSSRRALGPTPCRCTTRQSRTMCSCQPTTHDCSPRSVNPNSRPTRSPGTSGQLGSL